MSDKPKTNRAKSFEKHFDKQDHGDVGSRKGHVDTAADKAYYQREENRNLHEHAGIDFDEGLNLYEDPITTDELEEDAIKQREEAGDWMKISSDGDERLEDEAYAINEQIDRMLDSGSKPALPVGNVQRTRHRGDSIHRIARKVVRDIKDNKAA